MLHIEGSEIPDAPAFPMHGIFYGLIHLFFAMPLLVGFAHYRTGPRHWLSFRLLGAALILSTMLPVALVAFADPEDLSRIAFAPTFPFVAGLILALLPQANEPERNRRTAGVVVLSIAIACLIGGFCMFVVGSEAVLPVIVFLGLFHLPSAARMLRHGAIQPKGKLLIPFAVLFRTGLVVFLGGLFVAGWEAHHELLVNLTGRRISHAGSFLHFPPMPLVAASMVAPVLILWNVYVAVADVRSVFQRNEAAAPTDF